MVWVERHLFIKWAVLFCSLLLPLTALAGVQAAHPEGCGMAACPCPCCQHSSSRGHISGSSCACPGLPGLPGSAPGVSMGPEASFVLPTCKPALDPIIPAIFHPPENRLS